MTLKNTIVSSVVCGATSTFFIDTDGSVYCCGSGPNGMLGVTAFDGSKAPEKTVDKPTKLSALAGIPIKQVNARCPCDHLVVN